MAGVKWSLCSQHLSQPKHDSWGLDCCYGNHPPTPPPSAFPPPLSAWKCPGLLIWDHTSPPPSPRVNKSTFCVVLPCFKQGLWQMENGSGCTRVLNGAQLGFAAGKFPGMGSCKLARDGDTEMVCFTVQLIFLNFTQQKHNSTTSFVLVRWILQIINMIRWRYQKFPLYQSFKTIFMYRIALTVCLSRFSLSFFHLYRQDLSPVIYFEEDTGASGFYCEHIHDLLFFCCISDSFRCSRLR